MALCFEKNDFRFKKCLYVNFMALKAGEASGLTSAGYLTSSCSQHDNIVSGSSESDRMVDPLGNAIEDSEEKGAEEAVLKFLKTANPKLLDQIRQLKEKGCNKSDA